MLNVKKYISVVAYEFFHLLMDSNMKPDYQRTSGSAAVYHGSEKILTRDSAAQCVAITTGCRNKPSLEGRESTCGQLNIQFGLQGAVSGYFSRAAKIAAS